LSVPDESIAAAFLDVIHKIAIVQLGRLKRNLSVYHRNPPISGYLRVDDLEKCERGGDRHLTISVLEDHMPGTLMLTHAENLVFGANLDGPSNGGFGAVRRRRRYALESHVMDLRIRQSQP
jgi:hypothetical protein